ncbi:MAG: alpha-2-macroglobulin family protein, partial [Candidatus Kapaibacterium sp.]
DGTFTVTYRTDKAKEKNDDQDYVYRIQANVVDASRRSIGGMTAVKVTRGEFYVTARTSKYVYKPGDEMRLDVTTLAFDGDRPVSARFDVSVERYWWERNSRDHRETAWTGSGTTDKNGVGSAAFTLKQAGYYTATVTARDSRGTAISTSTSVYVADGSYSYWYGESNNDVQIIPDKEIYKPGETMSALVIMPVANVDALITTEGIALYNYQVQRLSSTSAIIRMPIEARFAPTVYLAASSIVNENFHTVTKRITVVPQGKILKLEVKTDRDIYKPGEKGSVTVRALDDNGEPVANTDIAISMVDEAVYAIHPDATPEIQKFFYGSRGNEVGTSTSLNFNFYTSARRSLAKDEMARGGADGMDAAQSMAAPKTAFAAAPPQGEALVQPVIRTDFRDLMYWTPSVRTDRNGVAHIDVTFPDNLTTWRITARGVTRATAVGQAKASVIARKNLLVRMETPRFITQGDALVIATTIHNYLGSEKKVRVEFAADGVTLAEREKSVTIPADGEKRIDWKITASKIGTAKLTVKALTNEESDAMELSVPILPQGVRSGASAIADLDDRTSSGSMSLSIPTNSTTESAGLTLALAPSAASSILGALDELIGYPYGCVEQTMSRFLPTVVVADALGKIKVPFSEKKRLEIPKMVAKGLGRLSELQHEDGGWGWWENDETNPFMTAYVMYGLTVAKGSGYDIPDDRYNNGLAALRRLIESRRSGGGLGSNDKKLEPTTEAYMLYVASFISNGSPDRLYTDRIAELAKRTDINNYGQALLALAAHYQNQSGLAGQFADRLRANATVSESIARWSGKSWHYNWQDDEVETSAFAIKALLEIRGEDDLVRKGIHFLLSQKKGTAWENTRQTAMVIYSLVDYVRNSHELDPDYTVTVRVNGRQVFTKHITSADIFAPEEQITIGSEGLRNGANDITIEKSGSGKLYASARMNYYVTGAAIKSASAGFKVERQYYTLRREQKNGTYVYTKQPYTGSVKSGDEIFVKVKITPDAASEYFMLEDPLPAGCEVVTNTDGYTIVDEGMYGGFNGGGKRGYMPYIWRWWYADRDVRDEKVAFFAPSLGAQTYEFSYVMRAQIPGTYSIMPSVGMLMYYPDVRGNSDAIA